LGSGDLLITFQSSDSFTGDYYLELVGYRYNCRIAQDSDRLLFCAGRMAPEGTLVPVSLRIIESNEDIFSDTVFIPFMSDSSQNKPVGGTPDLTPHPTSPPGPTP
jgi:hypothetical protein